MGAVRQARALLPLPPKPALLTLILSMTWAATVIGRTTTAAAQKNTVFDFAITRPPVSRDALRRLRRERTPGSIVALFLDLSQNIGRHELIVEGGRRVYLATSLPGTLFVSLEIA
jgi:hypothetical protein